jgi:pimeloyl-ACP methyl ester carboxylesterase/tetratricopeptide (TPR) repeat protein
MLGRSLFIAALLVAAPFTPARPQQAAPAPAPQSGAAAVAFMSGVPAGVQVTRVRVGTGVDLDVAQAGPVAGTPVLFLHGYTDSWFSYVPVLERLPAGLRAIVPSQRGHGESERPACCYGIGDFAADAVALLDALGIQRATVVGHSMGSFVAQRLAAERPDRVERLVLIGSGTTLRTEPVVEFGDYVRGLDDPIPAEFVHEFQAGTVVEAPPAAFMARVVLESARVPARVWREVMAGMLRPDSRTALERIAAPALIVWGEGDELFPRAYQDSLAAALGDARLVAYAATGHAPHWERPARFVEDLSAFIAAGTPRTNGAASAVQPRREHVHANGHVHADAHVHGGSDEHDHDHGRAAGARVQLLEGLGEWRHAVTTRVGLAQQYFDQGLRLAYAFNHDEALRSFEEAARLDPGCAMCYWGIAYALGPNINLPMEAEVEPRALAAIREAVRLAPSATPAERSYIGAMAVRFGEPAGAARAARDSAYAAAMRTVARSQPDDADAQVLFADAMMNLRPWDQWTRAGMPQPGTEEVVATLERVLALAPDHAGACHFYVHAVEASPDPDRALPCAERLPRLMPGAGHIVHMPAHVYLRVGRYEDAAKANIAAVEADRRFFDAHDVAPGIYPMFYAPHNLHFLWAVYLLSGQSAKAETAAQALVERVPVEDAKEVAALEAFLTAPVLTRVRFGDWKGVLSEPAPPAELKYVAGIRHYARGRAFLERGNIRAATRELSALRGITENVGDDVIIILNPAPDLLRVAATVLQGLIELREHRAAGALATLHEAVRLEDALTYDEPPPWYHPVRNILGEVLLAAGRYAEAEAAFRDDLRHVRENGWSLAGLQRALRELGRLEEAAALAPRVEQAWKHADVPPTTGSPAAPPR